MSLIIRKGVPYGSGDTHLYSTAPIGAVFAYTATTVPDTYLLCDGSSYLKTAYPELYAVIGDTYGSADDNHFNVPDLRGKFIEGTPSGETVGTIVEAGLPNITGKFYTGIGQNLWTSSGAVYNLPAGEKKLAPLHENAYEAGYGFDASRSNSIYGKSTTVQPPAVCVNYIIKAKSVATSADPLDGSGNNDKDYLITTRAEWNAMSANEKLKYADCIVAFMDEVQTGLVLDSKVVQGSENPVSGDAVYQAINTVSTKVTDSATRSRVAITSSYVPANSLYVARKNGVYNIHGAFASLKNIDRNNWIPIATLPTGYYPTNWSYGTITLSELGTFPLDVNPTTGEIRAYIYSQSVPTETDLTGKYAFVALTYIN